MLSDMNGLDGYDGRDDPAGHDGHDGPGTAAEAKRELRHAAFARRRRVAADRRAAAGAALARAAGALPLPDRGGTVAAYVSMGSEIETRPLLGTLLEAGLDVLVPMLGSGLDVGWGRLDALDALRRMDGRDAAHHRPDEPGSPTLPSRTLAEASLVLVPALAVDRTGTRLGRGGGWYDRALGLLAPRTPVIAVCWPWEVLAPGAGTLPREAHDREVDGVLTPDGLTMFAAG